MVIRWDDPEERLKLLESVSLTEYNELVKAHLDRSIVSTVNGRNVRIINTRFGQLYAVSGTARAFRSRREAEEHAAIA